MNNDNIEQVSGQDSTGKVSAIDNCEINKTQSRRGAIGVLSKLTLGAWSLPIVTAVSLPAHATMSVVMDDDDTTGEEEEIPPVLTLSNVIAIPSEGGCRVNDGGNSASLSFEIVYDYVSELGVVSHQIDINSASCDADEVTIAAGNHEVGDEIPQPSDSPIIFDSFNLDSGDETAGSIEARSNTLISGADNLLACSLTITITDAGGNTVSETISIEECDEDDFPGFE